jgi:hypothetical protein
MGYDYKGRRFLYRETVSGAITRHERHFYRDYLRIAAFSLTNFPSVIHTVVCDPAELVATRPLLLATPSGWWHTDCFDHVENITELFDSSRAISSVYEYAPLDHIVKGQVI